MEQIMIRRMLVSLGYVLVAIIVVVLTFVLVAYGNDYTYDFSTHKIVQKGHVIVESVPNGTAVLVDGKNLKKKTPYQGVWGVGQHVISLQRDGYWPWSKTIEVIAGQVSLANYAILVPKKPVRTVVDSRTDLVFQAISKDHRHLAYLVGGIAPGLYTLDLGGSAKPVKLYTPKAALPDSPAEILESVAWSDDASHVLIRSKIGDVVTYRLASANGNDNVNLTDQYKFDFTGLEFSASNWKQLYWLSPDGLRRLDIDSQSVSAVLADKVSQFWIATDRVLFVQQNDLGRSLWSLDHNNKRQRLIESLPLSDSYSVAFTSEGGSDQLAVVPLSTRVGTLYLDILSDNPTAKVIAHGATSVDFSPDGITVAFSSPTQIVTYNSEMTQVLGKPAVATISDQPGQLQSLTWFDSAHLLAVRDGHAYWFEYDGANRVDLGLVGPYPAWRTFDFKSVLLTQPGSVTTAPADLVTFGIR